MLGEREGTGLWTENSHEDGGRHALQIRGECGRHIGSVAIGIQHSPSKPGSPYRIGEPPTRRGFRGSCRSLHLWRTSPCSQEISAVSGCPGSPGERLLLILMHVAFERTGVQTWALSLHSCVIYCQQMAPPFRARGGGDCISSARTMMCT